jgi:hypothetical protein
MFCIMTSQCGELPNVVLERYNSERNWVRSGQVHREWCTKERSTKKEMVKSEKYNQDVKSNMVFTRLQFLV